MLFKKIFIVITLSVLLSACASREITAYSSSGNQQLATISEAELDSALIRGETTKSDVQLILGSPTDVEFDFNQNEEWTYTYRHVEYEQGDAYSSSSYRGETKDTTIKLVMIFDEDNTIINYAYTESMEQSTIGIDI